MSSAFHVEVGDLLTHPGSRRDATVTGVLEARRDMAAVDGPIRANLTLESTPSGVVATGSVAAPIALTCSRCLAPWVAEVEPSFTQVFAVDPVPDTFPIQGTTIDLEPALRDEVLAAVPVNVVHDPDCRGLCGTCGTDLNNGRCDCEESELSSPFAGLKDLFE